MGLKDSRVGNGPPHMACLIMDLDQKWLIEMRRHGHMNGSLYYQQLQITTTIDNGEVLRYGGRDIHQWNGGGSLRRHEAWIGNGSGGFHYRIKEELKSESRRSKLVVVVVVVVVRRRRMLRSK